MVALPRLTRMILHFLLSNYLPLKRETVGYLNRIGE